jgi:uncharacterized membrane protein
MDDKDSKKKAQSKIPKVKLPGHSDEYHYSHHRNNYRASLNIIQIFLVAIIIALISTIIVFEQKHQKTQVYTTDVNGRVLKIQNVYVE